MRRGHPKQQRQQQEDGQATLTSGNNEGKMFKVAADSKHALQVLRHPVGTRRGTSTTSTSIIGDLFDEGEEGQEIIELPSDHHGRKGEEEGEEIQLAQ